MWPASFWEKVYEPVIRRAAGLGRAARRADPDHYEKAHAFCDVLVIGARAGGTGGGARRRPRPGARVILCEEDFRLGGRLPRRALRDRRRVRRSTGSTAAEAELDGLPDVPHHAAHHRVRRLRRRHLCRARARQRPSAGAAGASSRASGCGASSRSAPCSRPARSSGRSSSATTTGPASCWPAPCAPMSTASASRPAGAPSSSPTMTMPAAPHRSRRRRRRGRGDRRCAARRLRLAPRKRPSRRGRAIFAGAVDPRACMGGKRVKGVEIAMPSGEDRAHRLRSRRHVGRLEPDHPSHHPSRRQAGLERGARGASARHAAAGHERRRRGAGAFRPRRMPCAAARRPAPRPPRHAASAAPPRRFPRSRTKSSRHARSGRSATAAARPSSISRTTSTVSDVKLAAREGFRSVEHLKRYTTLGMATDQGKTANARTARRCSPMSPGAPSPRSAPPPSARPSRRSPSAPSPAIIAARISARPGSPPSHRWAEEQGAVFVETGPWLRAHYYPEARRGAARRRSTARWRPCASASASATSRRSARSTCRAADAGIFLDRVYANTFSTLPVGKARYGLMLREDGFVLDDGTTARLAEDHYFMTTTTANAVKRHAASRILPPVPVAGARRADGLGHRAMGAVRRRRPARARRAADGRRSDARHLQRGLPLSRRRRGDACAAARRRGSSASPSPASSPTRSRCRRATAMR